ncbi:MAG: DUF89 family protein [Calditrichaceae bacterium]|nr:DUF89 family protein [Calditrichaceae bacterium]MBN2709746.1 DUF89 family protein [Calditrichaceae bacterium]RQV94940.1 MAG: DUF89 family protein [Calditrichota bacterium]
MKTELSCIPCLLRQTVETVNLAVTDDKIRTETVNAVLQFLEKADYNLSPPALAKEVYRILREVTGNPDPYREIKKHYNESALKIYDRLKQIVYQSDDPVLTSAKLAVAGNIIDFGIESSSIDINQIFERISGRKFEIDDFDKFIYDIKRFKSILYLADNAGEIVFDRLFIEILKRFYPERNLNITVVVRGAPIINDATIEDAHYIGLDKIAEVIDNGDNAPATILSNVSKRALAHYKKADIVISKGMGNYETLDEETRLIYYLLKVKCNLTANRIGAPIGSLVFKRNQDYNE